jgi:uncharacterized protein YbjT (DUF2867 family)
MMKVIITGSTGMVGEGVLHMCLQDPSVEKVLVINRRSVEVDHPKLEEIIHTNFYDISPIADKLTGYDACFFCLGISSLAVKADEYYKITYTLTIHVAETLVKNNSGMTFIYVSGQGTDSTEKGRSRWARVKGKTENDLMKLPFKKVYAYRPGFMKPIEGLKHSNPYYKYVNWMFPLGKKLFPQGFNTLQEVGLSMIRIVENGSEMKIIEGREISRLAGK